MFLDIGWTEFMVIGVVALVVIGPKDLPAALRVAGYWVRKARALSREFHSSVEQMMREVELHEVQQELKKATDFNIETEFQKIVDPVNEPTPAVETQAVPGYLDTSPAPADPVPPPAAAEAAVEEEPQLPVPMPTAHPDPEPARAVEPSKP
jgi:sec-independent protein translocase protein TatB